MLVVRGAFMVAEDTYVIFGLQVDTTGQALKA